MNIYFQIPSSATELYKMESRANSVHVYSVCTSSPSSNSSGESTALWLSTWSRWLICLLVIETQYKMQVKQRKTINSWVPCFSWGILSYSVVSSCNVPWYLSREEILWNIPWDKNVQPRRIPADDNTLLQICNMSKRHYSVGSLQKQS